LTGYQFTELGQWSCTKTTT